MKILAVDDEYYALELMKHALEEVANYIFVATFKALLRLLGSTE